LPEIRDLGAEAFSAANPFERPTGCSGVPADVVDSFFPAVATRPVDAVLPRNPRAGKPDRRSVAAPEPQKIFTVVKKLGGHGGMRTNRPRWHSGRQTKYLID
jgi:hypothetical protein